MLPPKPYRAPKSITQHGHTREDLFAWLRAENWRDVLRDPHLLPNNIAAHLEQENAYAKHVLSEMEPSRETLFAELVARLSPEETSVAWPDGSWDYFSRYAKGDEHPQYLRCNNVSGAQEMLFDANLRAKTSPYFALGHVTHSPDHRYIAWTEDTQGAEIYNVCIIDNVQKKRLIPPITNAMASFIISPDSLWIFWIKRDDEGRPRAIFRRNIDGGEDVLVYEETNVGFFLTISTSLSQEWIIIERGDHESNETLLISAHQLDAAPKTFAPRIADERYTITHWNNYFIILTNHGGAVDFQLMVAPVSDTDRKNWRTFLPESRGTFLLSVSTCADYLAWSERHEGNVQIRVISQHDHGDLREQAQLLRLEQEAYALNMLGFLTYETAVLRYIAESPSMPPRWIDFSPQSRKSDIRKIRDVPCGHREEDYETKQIHVPSPGGETIPLTLLMRKGQAEKGPAPVLLYGYGAYGISLDAQFSSHIFSLIDRGWIYAVAHVRGGSEKGWSWFIAGRGARKTNSFSDYLTCARYLNQRGYCRKGHIVAHGGSAGGLLVGAVVNAAPALFAGVAAQVPFVDVLTTMSDPDLPLTPPEWPEWGNPIDDAEAFAIIKAYSPYDNIQPLPYPPILALGGLTDPRVTYWEPAKWIAKLRTTASGGPFLNVTHMSAGHSGASGRFERLKDTAFIYAFALWAYEKKRVSQLSTPLDRKT